MIPPPPKILFPTAETDPSSTPYLTNLQSPQITIHFEPSLTIQITTLPTKQRRESVPGNSVYHHHHRYDNSDQYRRETVMFQQTTKTYYQHFTQDSNSGHTYRDIVTTIAPKQQKRKSDYHYRDTTKSSNTYYGQSRPDSTLTNSTTFHTYSTKRTIAPTHKFDNSGQATDSCRDTA